MTRYIITYPVRNEWDIRQADGVIEAEAIATIACIAYGFARIHLYRLGSFEHVVDFDVSEAVPSMKAPAVVRTLEAVQARWRVELAVEACMVARRRVA